MEDPDTASEIAKSLAKIIDPATIDKFYEDLLADPLTEISTAATDVIKTARLFTAPFQILGAFQDRFARLLDRVVRQVPEENQMIAPSHIAGPIFERLKYLEEDNVLTELYLNLLARAIDRERIDEAHPSFVNIIGLLSPDEALVLYHLRRGRFTLNLDGRTRRISSHTFPADELNFPGSFGIYTSHLTSLNLIKSFSEIITERQQEYLSDLDEIERNENREPGTKIDLPRPAQPNYFRFDIQLVLTEFVLAFVDACLPAEWNLEQH